MIAGARLQPTLHHQVPGAPVHKTALPGQLGFRDCFGRVGGSCQALRILFPSQIQTFSVLPGNHPTPSPFYSGCLQKSGLQASRCCPHLPGPFRPRQSLPHPPLPGTFSLSSLTPSKLGTLSRELWNQRQEVGVGPEQGLIFLCTKGPCESLGHASEEAVRPLFLRNLFTTPWSSSSVASCSFVSLFTHQTLGQYISRSPYFSMTEMLKVVNII